MKFRLSFLTALTFVAIAIGAYATTSNESPPDSNAQPTLEKQSTTPEVTAPPNPRAKQQPPREVTFKATRDVQTIDVIEKPNEHSQD